MEKLIVKNFGPIKEAEIDLTKYVVFIGDTSTGKSVLAKLIAIFRDTLYRFSRDTSKIDIEKELKFYNIDFEFQKSEIYYSFGEYNSSLVNGVITSDKQLVEDNFVAKLQKDIKEFLAQHDKFNIDIESLIKQSLYKLEQTNITTYIPAERILNSFISTSLSGLWANNIALPECFKDFAAKYEVARKEIKNIHYEDFGLNYRFDSGTDYIRYNDVEVKMNYSSTGIQSLTPLLLVFDNFLQSKEFKNFRNNVLIEEPELNLFPIKQKLLIEHVINKMSSTDYRLIITTHSPYILSVLDTLILAKNTYNEHPELKEEISAIISEDKWIDYNDISVYEVKNDGTIKSIKNEEFRSIDTNAIDGVSDIISEEFDKLTELRYAQ
ncbi:AAA family ATPase [Flavobacterium sp. DGU11]|uniref:AAA family ATPase n=1 Tax=Flavobacterium arundinis TaxID=3139143 RepID=A0ABU9HSE0_9FLAO